MVRSMYAGVSGMRSMQTALDVIGNNISNVRTYGFKSSRTTFADMYYQRLKGGSTATANRGGTNTSSVGYGGQVANIDVMHGQSSFTMTGRSMDMAIAGEGFFQVQDQDGNKFYTRAGMLSFDSAGNLVDSNGNFVLGVSGDPLGKAPGSDKITVNIPPVKPNAASKTETINKKDITIKASNNTEEGNVGFTFVTDGNVPTGTGGGVDVEIGATGAIVVKLNPTEKFANFAELSNKVNDKIKEKLGKEHPGGTFTIDGPADLFTKPGANGGLTGAELVGTNFGIKRGEVTGKWPTGKYEPGKADGVFGGITIDQLGEDFKAAGNITNIEVSYANNEYTVKITANNKDFTGKISSNNTGAGRLILNNNTDGTIIVNHPGFAALEDAKKALNQVQPNGPWETDLNALGIKATASAPSKDVGLSSRTFKLEGGTKGGPQGIGDVDGIMVGADGGIIAKHPVHGEIAVGCIGRPTGQGAGLGQDYSKHTPS